MRYGYRRCPVLQENQRVQGRYPLPPGLRRAERVRLLWLGLEQVCHGTLSSPVSGMERLSSSEDCG